MPALPVLSSSDPIQRLLRLDVGQVRFGLHDRLLYSTDASLYQVPPIAVVIPENAEQIVRLVRFASQNQLAILPRGGGTSLAGQCTAAAIVVDLSPNFRRVWEVDATGRSCKAEAGVVLEQLNRELAPTGLFFAPDPATVAQACIGGCIGNNAAGAPSVRYGRTSENLNGVDVILACGERRWLKPGAGRGNATASAEQDQSAKARRAVRRLFHCVQRTRDRAIRCLCAGAIGLRGGAARCRLLRAIDDLGGDAW